MDRKKFFSSFGIGLTGLMLIKAMPFKFFKKKESNRLETIKEEALSDRQDVDRVVYEDTKQEIVSESANTPYMDELSKYQNFLYCLGIPEFPGFYKHWGRI